MRQQIFSVSMMCSKCKTDRHIIQTFDNLCLSDDFPMTSNTVQQDVCTSIHKTLI